MKSNELRIGNRTANGFVRMIGYEKGCFGCWFVKNKLDSSGGEFVKDADIVFEELTEKTLQTLGFEKNDDFEQQIQAQFESKHMTVNFENGDFVIMVGRTPLNPIYHLHRLQNIYFELVGQELI